MLCKTIVIFKIKYTEDKNSHGLYTYSIDDTQTIFLNEHRYRKNLFFYYIHHTPVSMINV